MSHHALNVSGNEFSLVVAPTRELCSQIVDHLSIFKCPIVSIHGGTSIQKQLRLMNRRPTIVVATPGRLWDMVQHAEGSVLRESLKNLSYLVLDEVDKLFEKGRYEDLHLLSPFSRLDWKRNDKSRVYLCPPRPAP